LKIYGDFQKSEGKKWNARVKFGNLRAKNGNPGVKI
jgi:hypothetical protein